MEEVCLNILMFVSALIPKAFGSLLTSLVVALEEPANVSYNHTVCHCMSLYVTVCHCMSL